MKLRCASAVQPDVKYILVPHKRACEYITAVSHIRKQCKRQMLHASSVVLLLRRDITPARNWKTCTHGESLHDRPKSCFDISSLINGQTRPILAIFRNAVSSMQRHIRHRDRPGRDLRMLSTRKQRSDGRYHAWGYVDSYGQTSSDAIGVDR